MRKDCNKKLPKIRCEIEGCLIDDPKILHKHHLVERSEIGTSNHDLNLVVLCSNHHNFCHSGRLKIIGVYPSTKVGGRTVVYILDGKQNVDGIFEPYFVAKPKGMKI